ncbi:hypothetical protein GCM10023096_12450 [Nonomuraea ferruginea]
MRDTFEPAGILEAVGGLADLQPARRPDGGFSVLRLATLLDQPVLAGSGLPTGRSGIFEDGRPVRRFPSYKGRKHFRTGGGQRRWAGTSVTSPG